jgi:hypothetical protein
MPFAVTTRLDMDKEVGFTTMASAIAPAAFDRKRRSDRSKEIFRGLVDSNRVGQATSGGIGLKGVKPREFNALNPAII